MPANEDPRVESSSGGDDDTTSPVGRWQDEWQSVDVNGLSVEEARDRLATVRERLHEGVNYEGQEADAEHARELEAKVLSEADAGQLRAELHEALDRSAATDDSSVKAAEGQWTSLLQVTFLDRADTAELAAEAATLERDAPADTWRESVERELRDHRLVDQIADIALKELNRWDPLAGSQADGERLQDLAKAAEKVAGVEGVEQFLERLSKVDHELHSNQLEHFSAAVGPEAAIAFAQKVEGRDVDVAPTPAIGSFFESFAGDVASGQVRDNLATIAVVVGEKLVADLERLADAVEQGITHPLEAAEQAAQAVRELPGDVVDAVRAIPEIPDRVAAAWRRFERADETEQVRQLAGGLYEVESGILVDRGVGKIAGRAVDTDPPKAADLGDARDVTPPNVQRESQHLEGPKRSETDDGTRPDPVQVEIAEEFVEKADRGRNAAPDRSPSDERVRGAEDLDEPGRMPELDSGHDPTWAPEGRWHLPAGSKGDWSGPPGDSSWTPHDPGAYGLERGESIPFREGVPDFAQFAAHTPSGQPGLLTVPGLTGDHRVDAALTVKEIANREGITVPEVEKWLKDNDLRLHHYGGSEMHIVPGRLHDALHHQGSRHELAESRPPDGTPGADPAPATPGSDTAPAAPGTDTAPADGSDSASSDVQTEPGSGVLLAPEDRPGHEASAAANTPDGVTAGSPGSQEDGPPTADGASGSAVGSSETSGAEPTPGPADAASDPGSAPSATTAADVPADAQGGQNADSDGQDGGSRPPADQDSDTESYPVAGNGSDQSEPDDGREDPYPVPAPEPEPAMDVQPEEAPADDAPVEGDGGG